MVILGLQPRGKVSIFGLVLRQVSSLLLVHQYLSALVELFVKWRSDWLFLGFLVAGAESGSDGLALKFVD